MFLNIDCLIELAERVDQDDILQFSLISRIFYSAGKRAQRKLITKFSSIITSIKKIEHAILNFEDEEFEENIGYMAIRNGNLAVLNWCEKTELWPDNILACELAAENGHLHVLKWLRKRKCPWSKETCDMAAKNGHLECLKWARENDCEWSIWTCARAAGNGHFECLKWAVNNKCPIDMNSTYEAVFGGHLEILKYLSSVFSPTDWNQDWNFYVINTIATAEGHLEILKYFKETYNCHLRPILQNSAVKNGQLDVFIWLTEKMGLVNYEFYYDLAEMHNQTEIMSYIRYLFPNLLFR